MRKASSPYKKLLTAKVGDVFVLKGERFEFCGDVEMYLTSLDRRNNNAYYWIHVRNEGDRAVFERQELIDLLRSGKYKVS